MTASAAHLKRRAPRGRGTAWSRVFHTDEHHATAGIQYRLFRRDSTGRSYMLARIFPVELSRCIIARELLAMRRELRDHVDDLELRRLGLLS